MTTVITIDQGTPSVEIEDAAGEVHAYSLAGAPLRLDAFAVSLARCDGGGAPYRVATAGLGVWYCECGDAKFRAGRERRLCKHQRAARDLLALVRILGGDEVAKQRTSNEVIQAPVEAAPMTQAGPATQMIPAQAAAAAVSWSMVRNLAEAIQIADLIGKSNALADVRNPGIALLKIMAGAEIGFGPFASLTGVDIINGKPSVGAHLKAATIKRSDHYDYEIIEQDEAGTVCDVAFFERVAHQGGESRKFSAGWKRVGNVRFTIEQANEKGLTQGAKGTKDNWRTAPADMLFARCITKGQKRFCPDLIGGARTYDPDELDVAPEPLPAPVVASAIPAVDAEFEAVQQVETPDAQEPEGNEPLPEMWVVRFGQACADLGLAASAVIARLQKAYGVDSFRKLNSAQAAEVLEKLEAAAEKKKAG